MVKVIGVGDNVVDRYVYLGKMFPGGNSVNFAVYANQLGHKSAYMGVLAEDIEGMAIINALTDIGVDISHSERLKNGETGRCSIHLVNGDRIITDDNDFGSVKSNPLKITKEKADYIAQFDVVHSSCYSFLDSELHKIKKVRVPIVYDFSDKWTEEIFLKVCPNIDIAFFSGKKLPDKEIKEYMVETAQLGCSLAISTIGKRGAFVYNGDRFFEKAPYNIDGKVIDTLGAGDAFLTGFITTYIEGEKKYKELAGDGQKYTTQSDRKDYQNALIEYAMSMGNLVAIKNCMSYGAFGYSVPISE